MHCTHCGELTEVNDEGLCHGCEVVAFCAARDDDHDELRRLCRAAHRLLEAREAGRPGIGAGLTTDEQILREALRLAMRDSDALMMK